MTAITLDAVSSSAWWADTGISDEAGFLRSAAQDTEKDAERSEALFGEKGNVIDKIQEIFEECSAADWDGYNAIAVSPVTVNTAEILIRTLPGDLPMPEIAAEPDGEIALEWFHSQNRVFSISCGEINRISYAWIDGGSHGYAVAVFDGKSTPRKIVQGIQSALASEETGVRVT